MKQAKRWMSAAVGVIVMLGAAGASAQPGHHRDWGYGHYSGYRDGAAVAAGLVLGSALLWAATRPAPPAYETPVVTTVVAPPAVPPHSEYWYYCRPAGAYYPYVGSCPAPWEAVPARPY